MIFHIPHSSTHIPEEYLSSFVLSKRDLELEIVAMTDSYTLELFSFAMKDDDVSIPFHYSRLLVDVERFEQDAEEPMSAVGMGCVYQNTHDGKPLRQEPTNRDKLIEDFYRPHHARLNRAAKEALADHGFAIIIDCHSFPEKPYPYEFDQTVPRATICLGTDPYHTPDWMVESLQEAFERRDYSVAINKPFAGSMVPLDYLQKNQRIYSIMIEVRRDLYMNEQTGGKHDQFSEVQNVIQKGIEQLRVMQNKDSSH